MNKPSVGTRVRRLVAADLIGGKVLFAAGTLGRVIHPAHKRAISVHWEVPWDSAGVIVHAGDADVFERTCEVVK